MPKAPQLNQDESIDEFILRMFVEGHPVDRVPVPNHNLVYFAVQKVEQVLREALK